jgi:hypothetical protein
VQTEAELAAHVAELPGLIVSLASRGIEIDEVEAVLNEVEPEDIARRRGLRCDRLAARTPLRVR